MNYNNWKIKGSKGVFYLSSAEKRTDYPHEVIFDGKTYYHKEQDVVGGTLVGLRLNEPPFGGMQLGIMLEDGEETNVIQVNVLDTKGGVETWSREASKYLDALELGDDLKFALNKTKKDEKGYLYKNLFVNKDDKKVNWTFAYEDVPKGVKTTHPVTGAETTNYDASNKFYFDKIKSNVERLTRHQDSEIPSEVPESVANEIQDLPF